MATANETVADIIAEIRTINPYNEYADRIEAAHEREMVRVCGHQMILRLRGEGGEDAR